MVELAIFLVATFVVVRFLAVAGIISIAVFSEGRWRYPVMGVGVVLLLIAFAGFREATVSSYAYVFLLTGAVMVIAAYKTDKPVARKVNIRHVEKTQLSQSDYDTEDELYNDAVDAVVDAGKASTSLLQRRLEIGYARAARIIEEMEKRGVVSAADGSKPRTVLKTK